MNLSCSTLQNKRDYQEDRFFVDHLDENNSIFGVFDGHGGSAAADYASTRAAIIFRDLLLENDFAGPAILGAVIQKLNSELLPYESGTTASLVHINTKHKFADVAIIGDSPVIIKNDKDEIWIGPEHNVRSNKLEANEAVLKGGVIIQGYLYDSYARDYGGLQMSRTLGDKYFSNVLNRNAEVFRIPLNKNSWVLCGTDGILDPGHINNTTLTNDIVELITIPSVVAEDIIQVAINAGSFDNATAILARL